LDKTLVDFFPELKGRIENAERITLKMIVQHRSGIPDLTGSPDFWTNPPENNKAALERVLDLKTYIFNSFLKGFNFIKSFCF